jgi:hypothetical protein
MDCSTFAFDLHVLGTPPALILSQDQTLKLNWLASALARFSKLCSTQSPVDVALGFNPTVALACARAQVGRSSVRSS